MTARARTTAASGHTAAIEALDAALTGKTITQLKQIADVEYARRHLGTSTASVIASFLSEWPYWNVQTAGEQETTVTEAISLLDSL